jgi:hypothetical protein
VTSRKTITLEVTGPNNEVGRIPGFKFLWAYYVNGYDPSRHCQPCFRGTRVPEFSTPTASSGVRVALDRMAQYPYVYICGVGAGPKNELREKNLHLPLRYAEGGVVDATTYNNYRFHAENAELVSIPEPEAFEGKSEQHIRCKNFRFAVGAFGYPPRA